MARAAGQVMQAPPVSQQPTIIKCDNCGTENPGGNAVCSKCGSPLPRAAPPPPPSPGFDAGKLTAPKKTNWMLIGGILAAVALCCVAIGVMFVFPSRSAQATVVDVYWQTSVPLQEIRAVDYNNEPGSPPSGAYNVSCRDDSREVCEQRTIDRGNGYSEVVEDCHTETQQYCSYTVDQWTTIQTYTLDGSDLRPIYEDPSIASDQRLGQESEELTVTFMTENGEQETYSPESVSEFQQFSIGSTWTLKMNAFGGVVGVEP
jgi:hypothetical protein